MLRENNNKIKQQAVMYLKREFSSLNIKHQSVYSRCHNKMTTVTMLMPLVLNILCSFTVQDDI